MKEAMISESVERLLETALWSTPGFDDEHEFLDSYDFSYRDLPQPLINKLQKALDDFMAKAYDLFTEEELGSGTIEHDFWLTCHGHGAGFWDGDYEQGDEISALCTYHLEDDLTDAVYCIVTS